jgi:molybdopterin converting factor small subunit
MAFLVPSYELSRVIGRRIEIDAATVGELLDKATALYGDEFARTTKTVLIVINGIAINTLRGRKTKLTATDEVWFLKPAGGG